MATTGTKVAVGLSGAALVAAITGVLMFGPTPEPEPELLGDTMPVSIPQNFPGEFGHEFAYALGDRIEDAFRPGILRTAPEALAVGSLSRFQNVAVQAQWLRIQQDSITRMYSRRLLLELRKDNPDDASVDEALEALDLRRGVGAGYRSAPFFACSVKKMFILDCRYEPDMALWGRMLAEHRPKQAIIGWDNLNNIDQKDISRYPEYGRDIRAVVRLVRIISPETFVWVTTCVYQPTSQAWMEQVASLGDGVAIYGIAFFPAVEHFEYHLKRQKKDSGGKPVLLAGFFGVKPNAVLPPGYDFKGRMKDAIKKAKAAGFAGFCWMESNE